MCRYMEIVLEDILKEHYWTMHNYDDIMQKVNKTAVTGAIFGVDFITSGSVVFPIFSLFLWVIIALLDPYLQPPKRIHADPGPNTDPNL